MLEAREACRRYVALSLPEGHVPWRGRSSRRSQTIRLTEQNSLGTACRQQLFPPRDVARYKGATYLCKRSYPFMRELEDRIKLFQVVCRRQAAM